MMDEGVVQVLELPEMKLIGLSITSSFVGHEPERVEAMKREFNSRKDEISNIIHPERYLSPHFTSENLFTYMICMEVEELTNVPEGMLGFTIPAHRYVQVKSKGDPYEILHTYVREKICLVMIVHWLLKFISLLILRGLMRLMCTFHCDEK